MLKATTSWRQEFAYPALHNKSDIYGFKVTIAPNNEVDITVSDAPERIMADLSKEIAAIKSAIKLALSHGATITTELAIRPDRGDEFIEFGDETPLRYHPYAEFSGIKFANNLGKAGDTAEDIRIRLVAQGWTVKGTRHRWVALFGCLRIVGLPSGEVKVQVSLNIDQKPLSRYLDRISPITS